MSKRRIRIGVFHVGALGDCVLALHVARAVAVSPQMTSGGDPASVVALARSPVARLAVGRSVVAAYRDLDAGGMSALFAPADDRNAQNCAAWQVLRELDAIISFCGGSNVPPATRLREIVRAPVWAIDPRVRPETVAAGRHITGQWIRDLQDAGLNVPPPEPTALIRSDEADREYGQRCWADVAGRRRVLLHPGSGGRTKCWPIECYEILAHCLRSDGYAVAWMIGPVELDWFGEAFRERLARTARVVYEEDLLRAASVIACADAFVGNDSGISHVAAALGVPTIALFVASDPRIWQPIGPAVRVLGDNAGTGNCGPIAPEDVSSLLERVCGAR
jgi:hypothetical protein